MPVIQQQNQVPPPATKGRWKIWRLRTYALFDALTRGRVLVPQQQTIA